MNKIKYGIIGAGHLGNYHAQQLTKIIDCQLIGVFDISEHSAKKISKEYNVPLYKNYEHLLLDADAVSICTPASVHYKNAADALKNDCNMFIEKPLTNNLLNGQLIVEMNNINKKIIQVGHVERFNEAYLAYKAHCTDPLFIESHRLAPFNIRGLDVPVVLDLMIHDIDLILSIVKSEIINISATGAKVLSELIDLANARIEFKNGCVANITASRISEKPMRKMRIFEKQSYSSLNFQKQTCKILKIEKNGKIKKINSIEKKSNALYEELKSFIECIKLGTKPIVCEQEGLRALEIAIKIQNIIEQNK